MRYVNKTNRTIKVRGLVFRPGEEHDVADAINVPGFAVVTDVPANDRNKQAKQLNRRNKKK